MSPVRSKPVPASRPRRRFEVLVFFTGAVTLALEVLAARIMTPYFGVSLFVWAGVLAVTLVFLAVGYDLGGRLARGRAPVSLIALLLLGPLLAALCLILAAFCYPVVFPLLGGINLVVASFLGCLMLLAVPLVALAALNPLLIALGRGQREEGDGGAGRVFFISTLGSVAGVMVTAFVVIPHLSNWRALVYVGLALSLTVAGFAGGAGELPRSERRRLAGLAGGTAMLAGLLLQGQGFYFTMLGHTQLPATRVEVLGEYRSVFGTIKVVRWHNQADAGLYYLQDGILQNAVSETGEALDHTPALLRLVGAYASQAREILVLGLGAGLIPQKLRGQDRRVTVVEINPQSVRAAQDFFGFQPDGVALHQEDARTFMRRHPRTFDLIVVDLFQGDGTPDYLLTREFFRDVGAGLRAGGVVVFNAFFDPVREEVNRQFLATLGSAFPEVVELRAPSSSGRVQNAHIVAAASPLDPGAAHRAAAPAGSQPVKDNHTLLSARRVSRQELEGVEPVSDQHNIFSLLMAASQIRYRSQFNQLPWHLLVN